MREPAFIKRNQSKWQRFGDLLQSPQTSSFSPDEKAELFVQLTDDLSYSQTFYPLSRTTQYLNQLASGVYSLVYQNKREERGRLVRFWTTELPLLYYSERASLALSLLIFCLSVLLGVVSSQYDENFGRLILGDSYVNMTLENIKNGDPMGVYSSGDTWYSFVIITIHNIRVSFICFVSGVFSSLATGYFLVFNGIMVGAFQYFFYERGLFMTSFLTIWIHGTLEISAIIIAGAAGLVMGNSLLFPATYARLDSFIGGAKKGIKMVIGLVPIFITAGFLEGYVTRQSDMAIWQKISIIAVSALFVVGYFVIYPILLRNHIAQSAAHNE